jgi:lycopene cyclase domain-containing protein
MTPTSHFIKSTNRYWPLVGLVVTAFVLLMVSPTLYGMDIEVNKLKHVAFFETRGLYAFVLFGSILFPFVLSFDKKVHFYTQWPLLFKSVLLPAIVFIAWDMVFTARGIWGFNPVYHLPYTIIGLPIEECLWFFIIPYCCVFIYACLRAYFEISFSETVLRWLFLLLALLFGIIAIVNSDRMYTLLTFSLAAFFSLYAYRFAGGKFLSYFMLTWLVSLIPFFAVNGILTGMFTDAPVVMYSSAGNMGVRLGSIPIEDAFYLWDYLFIILWSMDVLSKKRFQGTQGQE